MTNPLVLRIKSITIYISFSGEKDNLNYHAFVFDQECICKIQELPLLHYKNIHKRTCALFSCWDIVTIYFGTGNMHASLWMCLYAWVCIQTSVLEFYVTTNE